MLDGVDWRVTRLAHSDFLTRATSAVWAPSKAACDPADIKELIAILAAEPARAARVEALALGRARAADDAVAIARQNFGERQIYSPNSEHASLELEELEAAATEDEIAARRSEDTQRLRSCSSLNELAVVEPVARHLQNHRTRPAIKDERAH